MPYLNQLEVWSCRIFPEFLFCNNLEIITKLSLYCVPPPPNDSFKLPNLTSLSVQSIGGSGEAQAICIKTLLSLCDSKLKYLNLDAITTNSTELNTEDLNQLVLKSPNLENIHFEQFKFSNEALEILANNFPNLVLFQANGDETFGSLNTLLEKTLHKFIEKHRDLRKLHFTVNSMEIEGFEILNREDFPENEHGFYWNNFHADSSNLLQMVNNAVFLRYEKTLLSKFWWLQDIMIKGTFK